MTTRNCVWDDNSPPNLDDELTYNDIWEPWKNIIISVKTSTANISHLQRLARRKNVNITTEPFAQVLDNRALLNHLITIQIASNGPMVSIELDTKQMMEQLCCEPLSIEGINVTFHPDRKKTYKPTQRLMNISLINIPPETPESLVTEYLEQYADIEGTPMYVTKTNNGRKYCTGTRVYQTNKLFQHIPRRLPKLFGRTIICIYDIQPAQIQYQQQRQNITTRKRQTIETSDTESEESTDNQWQQHRQARKKQNQQKRRQVTNNYNVKQNPLENNNHNFPQLQQQQNQNTDAATPTTKEPTVEEETTIIPETDPIPTTQNEEIFQSPSMVTTTRTDQITPEPNDVPTPETITENQKVTLKSKQQLKDVVKTFKAKKFTTQLQQTDFCDIGKLTKANKEEKEAIIAMSMCDTLGLYDPSNKYITNYKYKEVLQKYQEISKNRPTKNNNLLRLYNIMTNIELRG